MQMPTEGGGEEESQRWWSLDISELINPLKSNIHLKGPITVKHAFRLINSMSLLRVCKYKMSLSIWKTVEISFHSVYCHVLYITFKVKELHSHRKEISTRYVCPWCYFNGAKCSVLMMRVWSTAHLAFMRGHQLAMRAETGLSCSSWLWRN